MNKVYLDKSKMLKNLRFFRGFSKKITIMVKANAYGHGTINVVEMLKDEDVSFGVATIDEAIALRKISEKPILIVEPIKDFSRILGQNFDFVVEDFASLKMAQMLGICHRCYIKLNSGMNRFGFDCQDLKSIKIITKVLKNTRIKGLLTHFSSLNSKEETLNQYEKFQKARSLFGQKDLEISFGGSFVYKYNFSYENIRIGLGFYGYGDENLLPIAKLTSQIIRVFEVKKGQKIGYDGAFIASKNMRIGIVGIGYGDGIDRRLSNFVVQKTAKKCKIIGKICMDCSFVDLTGVEAQEGDEVVIFDDATLVADWLGTIPYEILTRLSMVRGERIVVCK